MKANTIQFRKKCRIGSYQYDPKALIGVGYYGKVYKGIRLADKYQVAVKVVDLNLHPDKQASKFVQNELKIHQIMKHQRVIHCLEIFKKNNIFYFVTEFFPEGDLEKYIKTWGSLSQEEALSLLYQVVQALVYLKKKRVVHRDIKPANIFMKDGNIKLADFGLSVLVEREIFAQELRIGTPRYMAPEILRQGIYSYKGDVWSLGCLFIQMIHGQAPLAKCESFEQIIEGVLGQMIPSTIQISTESRRLLESIFQVCQRKRISIQEIHSHPLFSGLIKKYSSISTQDNSQIHIEDIETQLQNPSLTSIRSSYIQTPSSINHQPLKQNSRLVQLFQKFVKSFPKQNTHFYSLNYIVNNLRDRNSLKLIDLVYVEQRINQRIKELRAQLNSDAQMQAIDLVYLKSVLEKDRGLFAQ